MDKKRVIVTGAKGQLGADQVISLEANGYEVYGFGRQELDITDPAAVERIFRDIRPHAVVHAAAYTQVDQAQEEPELAYRVNAFGTRNVAAEAEKAGASIVYVSTDYVFNGVGTRPYDESTEPSPINVYGQSKLAGEMFVRGLSSRYYIVRTSWVYGQHGGNFVKTMLRLAETKNKLSVVADQVGSPTYTVDLADCIVRLLDSEHYGIYHAAGSGQCSWYEFAKAIFENAGLSIQVEPVTTAEFPRPAPRPEYSVLGQAALTRAGIPEMRHWQEALADFLDHMGLRRLAG